MSNIVLGFVGLGRMGSPMSKRLLAAGHVVKVFDTDAAAIERAVEGGGQRAASLKELADSADIIFTSLPTPQIVKNVICGDSGLSHGTRVKSIIELSTIGPRSAAEIAKALADKNINWVEAPVSGGIKGAEAGTLAVMVSCVPDLLPSMTTYLQCLGKIFFAGEKPGLAQTAKLANNMLSAVAMVASAEVLTMGVKAGLDPKVLLDIINAGSGRNSATMDKIPRAVLSRRFDYGFANDLSYKDVRLCIDEAEAMGVPMVASAVIRQMLAVTSAKFGPGADVTDVTRIFEEWAGVEIKG
jgi:3-hydroxyisobutyrate dehydrogenase-like beta-hydroxyacid dehydrogenase